jgi:hypothetical protein
MAPDRGRHAREERLAELLAEFSARQTRQSEALAALVSISRSAREQVERSQTLHEQAGEQIDLLRAKRRKKRVARRKP